MESTVFYVGPVNVRDIAIKAALTFHCNYPSVLMIVWDL